MQHRFRQALTFENVLVTILAFVVLAGGTAIAANQLAKNSVGKKQLKAKSVGTAELKTNAVTTAKIKKAAVSSAKVKDGTVAGTEIDAASTSFSRIVHEARGSGAVAIAGGEGRTAYPVSPATYTQQAGEDDWFFGAVDVTFEPGCVPPRTANGSVLVDASSPLDFEDNQVLARGEIYDETGGTVSRRMNLSGFPAGILQGPAATTHTLTLVVESECDSGAGVVATSGAVDVVGAR